jgi:hypothetical protein
MQTSTLSNITHNSSTGPIVIILLFYLIYVLHSKSISLSTARVPTSSHRSSNDAPPPKTLHQSTSRAANTTATREIVLDAPITPKTTAVLFFLLLLLRRSGRRICARVLWLLLGRVLHGRLLLELGIGWLWLLRVLMLLELGVRRIWLLRVWHGRLLRKLLVRWVLLLRLLVVSWLLRSLRIPLRCLGSVRLLSVGWVGILRSHRRGSLGIG